MMIDRILELKSIFKSRIINTILIIVMSTFVCNCFVGCDTKNKNVNNTENKSTEEIKESQKLNNSTMNEVVAEIEKTQIGLFTKMAYASKDKVILYGPVGLIVYDIQNQKIYRAINLKAINMNVIQGDEVTVFKVKEDGSQILMYNELMYNKSNYNERYLYDIENDKLEKTHSKEFENEYDGREHFEEINPYTDKYLKKYKEMECFDYIYIDKSNVCYLMHPSEDMDLKGISHLKILMVNKETNEEKIYTV